MASPIKISDISDNGSREISDEVAIRLRRFAGIKLEELSKRNPRLLVFPHCLGDNGDDIGKECLFSLGGESLHVGNVVGFWEVDNIHVHVHSRFDTDKRQYFFHYMLQRVGGVNVLDMHTMPDEEDVWDFLIYLFPLLLKKAMAQGVFRTYRVFEYNDDHLRGNINVARFLRRDIPFGGRIAYSTREHTPNNHVIQLVRHTVEFIRRRNPMLLTMDSEMRQAVGSIVQITPDYDEHERGRVVSQNLRPVRHPYYSAYTALQKICLQILRHERITFGEKNGDICGIVFDAAWLWEEYLAKIFSGSKAFAGVIHPQNKLGKSPVYFLHPNLSPHYPDFYDEKRRVVMDAKYKRLENNGIGRDDLFQLISYMHVLKYDKGALVFPSHDTACRPEGVLNGFGGYIGLLSLAVPNTESVVTFQEFALQLQNAEEDFLRTAEDAIHNAWNNRAGEVS